MTPEQFKQKIDSSEEKERINLIYYLLDRMKHEAKIPNRIQKQLDANSLIYEIDPPIEDSFTKKELRLILEDYKDIVMKIRNNE